MSNPFELRFRLLEMAQQYLQESMKRKEEFSYQMWELAKEQGEATMELYKSLQPENYSINNIKKKAEELYSFVEKRNENEETAAE
jgi:predicted nuclease with TOPRIM domain